MTGSYTKIYVGSVNFNLDEGPIRSIFQVFGPIKSVQMSSMDMALGHHKGFCFVDYLYPSSATEAIEEMNGFQLCGRPIKVNWPSIGGPPAEIASQTSVSNLKGTQLQRTIYVGNVFWEIGVEDVRSLFEPFGKIRSCSLIPNPETGKHRGYGFIEFEDPACADTAISTMNDFPLAERQLKVNRPLSIGLPNA